MDIGLPSPLDNLLSPWTLLTHANKELRGELPGSEEGFIRVFRDLFFLFFPFVYLGVNTLE